MKVQQLNLPIDNKQQNNNPPSAQNPQFKGLETLAIQGLRFLQTNQAWGACAVDVGCMGAPRTAVDFTRGPDAGIETARREFSSTGNHALIGLYGSTAALLLCHGFNKLFPVQAHKMFMSDETLDFMAHHWDQVQDKPDKLTTFLDNVLSDLKGFSPEHENCDDNGFVSLQEDARKLAVTRLKKEVETTGKLSKESLDYLKAVLAESVGSESNVKLERAVGEKTLKTSGTLENIIIDIFKSAKAFTTKEVAATFGDGKPLAENKFINGLKKLNPRIAIGGLAVAVGIGSSVQPLNAYLTKKKTGKSGFVGVQGQESEKSSFFPVLKLLVAGAFAATMLRTIGKYSEIIKKVQFKGLIPTIEQFKLIYCTTIMSRILAARDKNELRESAIKDTLGFVNWLILGGFVSTLAAAGLQKLSMFKDEKFIRYNKKENGESWFKWLTKSSIISRDEVLLEAFKKLKLSVVKGEKALSFKEMFNTMLEMSKKEVQEGKLTAEEIKIAKMAIKKVRWLGAIQFAGYLWSGLALGVGIPKLNIAITKHVQKKKKAEQEAKKQQQIKEAPDTKQPEEIKEPQKDEAIS